MYYKVKIQYKLTTEGKDGFEFKKEDYLVNADSVTYAEAKIIKDLPDNYKDKMVLAVTPSNIVDVVNVIGKEWFVVGLKFATGETDKKGNMKYSYSPTMINGDTIDEAIVHVGEHFSDSDIKIVSVQSTKIIIFDSLLSYDVKA